MTVYGADVAELRRVSLAISNAADELDAEAGMMTRLLDNVCWIGDVATRYVGKWTGVQLPSIGLSTRFLRDAANHLAQQANEQEQASVAGLLLAVGAVPPVPKQALGPSPVVVDEKVSSRETKSGVVVRGVDGSEIRLRELSDGSFEVVVTLSNGMTADAGDAMAIFEASRGKLFSDGGVEWDADATYTNNGSTTWTFDDEETARKFYAALEAEQDSAGSTISGLTWHDVRQAVDATGDVNGQVSWEGFRNANRFSASAGVKVQMGDSSESPTLGVAGELSGFTAETVSSDGSTGELSNMSGSVSIAGELEIAA